jgi:hypothetical protein
MPDNVFIDVPFDSSETELVQRFTDALQTSFPTWSADPADLATIQAEALAPLAQNAADVASQVPAAIFRALGGALFNVPYLDGAAASTSITFTAIDTAGHSIDAGVEVEIDGVAFATRDAATIAPGATTTVVSVDATIAGEFANGLDGSSTKSMISSLAFISGFAVNGPTAGGSDAETDLAYQDRLTNTLLLSASTLVTTRDYELIALSQTGIARARAVADPVARTITVIAMDASGNPISSALKATLAAVYDDNRQATWVVTVADPTYTTVSVVYGLEPYPGFDEDDLYQRVDDAITAFLSPSTWGDPKSSSGEAMSFFAPSPVVRRNKLIDIIGDVDGVDYVIDVQITGSAGTVDSNGDLTMPGTIALPLPGTISRFPTDE